MGNRSQLYIKRGIPVISLSLDLSDLVRDILRKNDRGLVVEGIMESFFVSKKTAEMYLREWENGNLSGRKHSPTTENALLGCYNRTFSFLQAYGHLSDDPLVQKIKEQYCNNFAYSH